MKTKLHINQLEELDEVLAISNEIFEPSSEELQKYHNRDDWSGKLNNGGLMITAWNDNKMVGFSICYPKENGFHIWNVGVLKEYRRQGIWEIMHEIIQKFGRENNYNHLTINTYKDKFPGMYKFVLNNGYTEYKTEGDKSFFIKEL